MKIACLVIDFRTTAEARKLTLQLAEGQKGGQFPEMAVSVFHVDNANTQPVELTAEQLQKSVELIRNPHNDGYAGGIKGSIEQIRAGGRDYDAYWFLNSDLEVEPDCLGWLVKVLIEQPRVGALGPRVMKGRTAKVWGERGVVSPLLGVTAMTEWPAGGVLPKWSYIPGSSILVRTKAYDQVGGITDRYRLYYEETELCVQMQKAGWDLWVEPRAIAYHSVNSIQNRIPARHFAFYFARNNLYFWQKNFGIPWAVQLPRAMFVIGKELVLPLRRSENATILFDRLKYVAMGFADGFHFLKDRHTFFEKRHFDVNKSSAKK